MIFVIAAIFILVVSFVIALVSLIREQSKIEKENVVFGKNQDQQEVKTPQAANKYMPQPNLTNIGTTQPQSLSQPQPTAPSPDYNVMPLKQKPWWEKEIQKRNEEESGRAINWQNTGQVQRPPVADVLKTEETGKVVEPQDNFGVQTSLKNDQDLQGSFSVSDLTKGDQES